jgi:amidase
MSDSEIVGWSSGEIVARVAAREISTVEVVSAFLERANDVNGVINAICTSTADDALREAERADRRLQGGYSARVLEGVPYTVKDNIPTRGVRCTYGAELYADFIPDADAVSVERLRSSGAILVGKSNTPEMADDPFCNTTNALFGQTRNPWDVNRTPGASTGGGAAATAAGLAPLALGTDWGGSIRGPAAFCGVVGFRPSSGLIPVYPDDTRSGFAWDFAIEHGHAPMGVTVADVSRAAGVLIGPDERAPAALPSGIVGDLRPGTAGIPDLRGRRVALSVDFGGIAPVEAEVAEQARSAALVLEALGCEVTEAAPKFERVNEIIAGTRALGVLIRYSGYPEAALKRLSPRLTDQIKDVASVDLSVVAAAERARTALFFEYQRFMHDYDYLVSPTWGVRPFRIDVPFEYKIDGRDCANYFDCILFTYVLSVLGAPSVSVPSGLSHDGLPIGIQIAGGRYRDGYVLDAAAAYELARGPMPLPPDIGKQTVGRAHTMFLESPGNVAWRSAGPE